MDPTTISVTVVLFGAIIGAYAYVHKVSCEISERNQNDKKALYERLDKMIESIGELRVTLTNRLTRIETLLSIDPPDKA